MPGKIVVFGAGATGRGHVGLLAWQAGFEIVFVDKDAKLVETLQRAGRYTVHLFGGRQPQTVDVTGWRVYHYEQRDEIASEILDTDLVLTAVFDPNLPDVAQTLARAVKHARAAGRRRSLNCLACENMMDSSSTLGKQVTALLTGTDLAYAEEWFGFPDCMISRVVPRPEPDPLVILTEDYNEWTTRAEAFKGPKPAALSALELVNNQTARLERKLLIHNGGHAICGYFGYHRGHRFIHQAVADPLVLEHVVHALDEIGEIVRRRHGFSAASINEYKADLGRRGAIAELQDQILRVVRDPIRKLSPRERLIAPAVMAEEYSLPRAWIVQGIVAALQYSHPQDAQSLRLAADIRNLGLEATLVKVCGLSRDSRLTREIVNEFQPWREPIAAPRTS
jgi:mannitol-1-phosphate 5-dehydrogenase